jgi:hypothetical protein
MIRQALVSDIPQIQLVRNAVKENTLSDPALVPDQDVEDYINRRGRGWVWEEMMNWYFKQTDQNIWLSTSPGTRAEGFYRKAGWQETGIYGKGEIRFEMSRSQWQNQSAIS